jgi:Zn2+/Cd2+-exporting ATPase
MLSHLGFIQQIRLVSLPFLQTRAKESRCRRSQGLNQCMERSWSRTKDMGPQLVLLLVCFVTWMVSWIPGFESASYLSATAGSVFTVRDAYVSLKSRQIDVNLLMLLAAVGAVSIGQPRDAASLFLLFSLSSWLESRAMAKTTHAISQLMKLRPDHVTKIEEGESKKVSLDSVRAGDIVSISAFENVALDGEIVLGATSVDESSLTGESIAVPKALGEMVSAGTQNLEGTIQIRVTNPVGSTALDKIVSLIEQAQENKGSGEKISHWFGQTYTIIVIGLFLISLAVRLLTKQPLDSALYSSIVLLVGLSPCALVISTPAATLSAMTRAARSGILVRGGEFIEKSAEIDLITMDKTGTITEGKPKLLFAVSSQQPDLEVEFDSKNQTDLILSEFVREPLRLVASTEANSSHPIAKAFVTLAASLSLPLESPHRETTHPGLGIEADFGSTWLVGNDSLLTGFGIEIPISALNSANKYKSQGLTTVFATNVGEAENPQVWVFALGDAVRAEAAGVIRDLTGLGIKEVHMLTGDKQETGVKIASTVGIKHVKGGLLPADKTKIVEEFSKHSRVMMVGDGVNDAPALTRASVGVAMGGLGSDIALNAADVVLMKDRLTAIPELIRLGRKTKRIIWANMSISIGMILLLSISSLFVQLPLPLAVLGHEGSTVIVILNGLRLLRK